MERVENKIKKKVQTTNSIVQNNMCKLDQDGAVLTKMTQLLGWNTFQIFKQGTGTR